MSTAAVLDHRVRLREQTVTQTYYVLQNGVGHYQVHVATHPKARPLVLVTRDRVLYDRAVEHEANGVLCDVWFVKGKPAGLRAGDGVLCALKLAESES